MSWEVDDFIAIRTIASLKLMYAQYGILIKQIQDPRDILIEEFYDILKTSEGTSYDIHELCRIASENDKHIKEYLNGKWTLDTNINLKNIIPKLEERQYIKIIKFKPRTLQFIPVSDTSDTYDRNREGDFEKNNNNFENNEDSNPSYISDTSDSNTIEEKQESDSSATTNKLVKISNKSPPIEMTNEQHDSFFGNNEKGDNSN